MIDDTHIYHFLKVLLNRLIRKVSNESTLMQSSQCHLQDVFSSSLEKDIQRLQFFLKTNNEILIYMLTVLLNNIAN